MSLFVITQDHNIAQALGTLGQRYKVQGHAWGSHPDKAKKCVQYVMFPLPHVGGHYFS